MLLSFFNFFPFDFWSESIWLPSNHTWSEFENLPNGKRVAHPRDLWIVLPTALCIHVARILIERYLWYPIGIYLGLKEKKSYFLEENLYFEKIFRKNRRPNSELIKLLSDETNTSEKLVGNWFRKKRNNEKSSLIRKFTEAGWKTTFYFISSTWGIYIMWDKPWIFNTKECWEGFPFQHLTTDIYVYYIIELSYYTTAAISIFFEVHRKDFYEFFVHHLVTISLLFMSWSANFYRIGSYVIVIHDFSDYWLEGAKMAKYLKYNRLCDIMFVIFASSWFVTRCLIYPHQILGAVLFEGPKVDGFLFPISIVANCLLIVLQVLHCIWFVYIFRVVLQVVRFGEVKGDPTSESELSASDVNNESHEANGVNGAKKMK